jgi:hypothetical protein
MPEGNSNKDEEAKKTPLSDAVSSSEGEIERIEWGKDSLKVFRKDKGKPDIYNKTALDSMGFLKPHNFFSQLEDNILQDKLMFGTLMEDPDKIQSQIEYYEKYVGMLKEYKTALHREKSYEKRRTTEDIQRDLMKFKEAKIR